MNEWLNFYNNCLNMQH